MTGPPKMLDFPTFDRALGAMVREAAMLEHYLETIVKVLCGSPHGALLISGESTSRVLTVCKALIDAHTEIPEEHRTDFKKMLTDAKTAFEQRHTYVHGAIAWQDEGIPGNARSRRLKHEPDFHPIESDDLHNLAQEFNRLIFRAGYFLRLAIEGFPDHLSVEYSED
ncbi:hypothetical protein ACFWH1_10760 [Streptomyces sp. NPDC127037]|uniref:hypothetical protein n=1 Tax=Streptomyces sp. NPDC127037 TaxID=3347113 RepID=UPI00364871F1